MLCHKSPSWALQVYYIPKLCASSLPKSCHRLAIKVLPFPVVVVAASAANAAVFCCGFIDCSDYCFTHEAVGAKAGAGAGPLNWGPAVLVRSQPNLNLTFIKRKIKVENLSDSRRWLLGQ